MWKDEVPAAEAKANHETGTVPLLLDADQRPLKRNFVHVDDLASAILAAIDNKETSGELYNICMDEPVDYGEVARYLGSTRALPAVEIPSRFHSNWMDNAKAKQQLGWRPGYDLKRLIDSAWDYARSASEPRKIWYPG